MPISYTNRKGQKYFLHKKKDKAGKIRCHCSLQSEGDLATAVPAELARRYLPHLGQDSYFDLYVE